MTKKKVAFIHGTFPCGGAERVTMDIANYITSYNYEVYVIASEIGEGCPANITTIQLPVPADLSSMENADFIIESINKLPIDIFVMPIIIYNPFYILSRIHCKFVFALHSTPFWESINRFYGKKRKADKSFFTMLEWYLFTYPKAKWLKVYEKRCIKEHRQIYERADAYTVLCEGYKTQLIRSMKVSPNINKFCVIPNSEKQVENVTLEKKKQILFVGRMTYQDKQLHRLLKIWDMIYDQAPEWELILVGDGPEREKLEIQARKLKLKRFHFIGYTTQVEMYYRNASIICLTSNFEGWPLCLTEGQANGVVPIAFDCVAGIREIIYPSGTNGILVSPFSLKEFAKALLELINDPEKLKQMQQNVVLKSKEYSQNISEKKWLELFDSL